MLWVHLQNAPGADRKESFMNRFRFLFLMLVGLLVMRAGGASADGMVTTGSAIRTKSIGPITVKVYSITHQMKEKPATRSKAAMIEADTDKQFVWYMQRDVDAEKIKTAMRDAFKLNGYGDSAKVEQFVGAFGKGDLVEYDRKKDPKPSVQISYNAASKGVTINVNGHGSATIAGPEFMKAVWSIWFGKIEPASIGDNLMSAL